MINNEKPFTLTPITTIVAIAAIGVSAWWWEGGDIESLTLDFRVWSQPWRLISSVLPHVNAMHLLFNVYWLFVFGTAIETEYGSLKTATLFVLLGTGSALAEFAFATSGVGLSGIGYGLFAYLWVLSRQNERFASIVRPPIGRLFVLWFFLCIVLTVTDVYAVGNVAHAVGALLGAILGWCNVTHTSDTRIASRLLLFGTCGTIVLAATVGRPYLNWTDLVGREYAYRGYLALTEGASDDAVYYLTRAVAEAPDSSESWFNLGIAFQRTARYQDAIAAYEHALELSPDDVPYREALIDLRNWLDQSSEPYRFPDESSPG